MYFARMPTEKMCTWLLLSHSARYVSYTAPYPPPALAAMAETNTTVPTGSVVESITGFKSQSSESVRLRGHLCDFRGRTTVQ